MNNVIDSERPPGSNGKIDEPEAKPLVAAAADDWVSRVDIQTLVLIAATAFGIYICYRLTEPLLPSMVWALALAVLFTPLQQMLEAKIKRHSVAAAVSVLAIDASPPPPQTAQQPRNRSSPGTASVDWLCHAGAA